MSEVTAPKRRGRPPGSKSAAVSQVVSSDVPVYVARKPMRIGDRKIRIGEVVPEAGSWLRVESWLRGGFLDVRE